MCVCMSACVRECVHVCMLFTLSKTNEMSRMRNEFLVTAEFLHLQVHPGEQGGGQGGGQESTGRGCEDPDREFPDRPRGWDTTSRAGGPDGGENERGRGAKERGTRRDAKGCDSTATRREPHSVCSPECCHG